MIQRRERIDLNDDIELQCVAVRCSPVAACCSLLQSVIVCHSVLCSEVNPAATFDGNISLLLVEKHRIIARILVTYIQFHESFTKGRNQLPKRLKKSSKVKIMVKTISRMLKVLAV